MSRAPVDPDAIAVIGMAGRFPGAADLDEFWRNLAGGVESVRTFGRAELLARGVRSDLLADPCFVRAGAVLDGIEMFDADFFGFTPREAELTEPQHRVFLECAWEALEDSGYDPEGYDGAIGVYAGAGFSSYLINYLLARPDMVRSAGALALQIGNNKDYVPLRVSYKLRLRGPSVNVNTACSSSLVAVHLACQSILDQQCDIALAGGVGIQVPQDRGYLYEPNGILSPDGHCRAFDARAEGTVSGNGAGVVVLKRYADAVADGDAVRAVILGSAVNNDGGSKVGFTAPSVAGQARVIGEALSVAGVDPDTLGYVEAHGTGTSLGDPIEVAALTEVFRASTSRTGFCGLGSLKTNIGHLDEAAGVAGLIKTVLALQHAAIPPSLHFEVANPAVALAESPFYVPRRLVPWQQGGSGARRAGVSSFGIGGTNAHAVLEEAPASPPATPARPWQMLPLSARSPEALDAITARLATHLRDVPDQPLADVAYTLHVGRKAFAHRRIVLCRDRQDALAALEREGPARLLTGRAAEGGGVAFLFPGQGSQHRDMGRGLYRDEPLFRDAVDACAERLMPELGRDLRRILFTAVEESDEWVDRTEIVQPMLFTVGYALASLLCAWGIRPRAMMGHSVGEYVAACLAGVMSLDDALVLVATRGRLMQAMAPGAMLAVELPEDEVRKTLDSRCTVALVNAPGLSVVAGPVEAVGALEGLFLSRGVACRRLRASHAFHSEAMQPAVEPFLHRVRQVALSSPSIPFVSNVTGDWITSAQATDPAYWAQHLRAPVRFSSGLGLLLREEGLALLDVGPSRTLAGLIGRHPGCTTSHTVVSAMRHPRDERSDDSACLLEAVGRLWLAGACERPRSYAGEGRRRVPLPTYPFERQRYWIDPPASDGAPVPAPAIDDWFHVPTWRPARIPDGRPVSGDWLLFVDACGVGERLAERLRAARRRVRLVRPAAAFSLEGEDGFAVDPCRPDDYHALLSALDGSGGVPANIVHLWSVTAPAGDLSTRWDDAQDRGFLGLVFLVQALARRRDARGLTVSVVSSHMQAVSGAEASCPEKATLLGPIRLAPIEYPDLRCRSIDLAWPEAGPWEAGVDVDLLLRTLLCADIPETLAQRDGAMWRQAFSPHPLPPPSGTPRPLRERGTYLITGGLGSMGLALARHLAREVRARVVLVGRGARLPGTATHLDRATAPDLVRSLEAVAEREAALLDVDADARLTGLLRSFCARLVMRYLRDAGVELRPGVTLSLSDLRWRLGVVPAFEGFLSVLVGCLADDGVLARSGSDLIVTGEAGPDTVADLRRKIVATDPRFEGTVRLLDHCAAAYRPALAGEMPSIEVLYPDGTPAFMDECGRDVPAYARDGVYLRVAARLVAQAAASSPGRLRVLEVGGGAGGLTRAVLAALEGREVEYLFTDLGNAFVRRAEREAALNGVSGMSFGVLDIARDHEAQGYASEAFDVVLGYNVVHAAPTIADALGGLRRLLAPGGLLLLVETTRLRRWDEMVWGLTEGWWHFADRHLRVASPLLAIDTWERVLREEKFASVAAYPRESGARRTSDVCLLVARRSDPVEQDGPVAAALADIEASGGEALVARADAADEDGMRAVLAEARARFGELNGVIHAAGVLGQDLIGAATPDSVRPVMAAKAGGLIVLDRLLEEQVAAPDFLILCSSVAAVAPIAGQVDYCAANAFLDAYAAHRAGRDGGPTTVSIGWGFWQELGMIGRSKMPEADKRRIIEDIAAKGLGGAGVDAFRRILAAGAPPLILVAPDGLGDRPRGDAAGDDGPVHPWFDRRIAETGTDVFVTRLEAGHWVLDEHRPFGEAVLPGTAYLELARAALDARGRGRPVQLNDVYFLAPLAVPDGESREVRTILRERGEGFDFVILSRAAPGADEWHEHARGEIDFLTSEPPPRLDVELLERRCREADLAVTDGTEESSGLASRFARFTPHWRCVERVWLGNGEGVAALRLAGESETETAILAFHPSLADMATGFLSVADGFEAGVPFHYRRVRLWRPLRSSVRSHVRRAPDRRSGERSYDVGVCDDAGEVLLDVAGFTMRMAADPRAALPGALEAGENFRVTIGQPGHLHTLAPRAEPRRAPRAHEVEIEVAAAGLNFIEVLYGLGLLPEPPGGEVCFGLECAGTVSAVGSGVTSFSPGDHVFGFASGAFGRYVITDASTVARMPADLSPAEAATLPAAYTTAYYALLTRARLRRGERVLIHSASGGLGLAAVAIARWCGAEILATAGTPEKRDHLRGLGIAHVFDSRSLDFADRTLEATEGRGVDVVVNSLGGDFIPAGLRTLARHGRFLELGKRDILGNGALALAPFEKHLAFMAIDVGPDLPDFDRLWRQVVRGVRRGTFRPLPLREFPLERVADAFAFMAQGKHIGKVVIVMSGAQSPQPMRRGRRGRPLADILGRGAERAGARPLPDAGPARIDPRPAVPSHARPALTAAFRAPDGPIEAEVAAIWEDLLGVSGVGADDNFFELRGDSLLAAQATSRIYAAFDIKLPLTALFDHPTPARLAARIEQMRRTVRDLATAPASPAGEREVEHEL